MNDITKARYFFETKGSKLKDLQSFRLMLATANDRYLNIRRLKRSKSPRDLEDLDPQETDALVDFALLKYLGRHNKLPENAPVVLRQDISLREKKEIALVWVQAL